MGRRLSWGSADASPQATLFPPLRGPPENPESDTAIAFPRAPRDAGADADGRAARLASPRAPRDVLRIRIGWATCIRGDRVEEVSAPPRLRVFAPLR
jgi:hypothetical protein